MADAALVGLLLAFIWAAVLVPPAAGARASREAEFLGSIRPGRDPLEGTLGRGPDLDAADQPRFRPALTANARRRQVLGGLVVAMGATLVLGLLPTFRLLLVVHLLLVNSSLAYVGLLVHMRDQQTARTRVGSARPAWAVEPASLPADTFDFSSYAEADLADEAAPVYAEAYATAYADAEYDDDADYAEYAEYDEYDDEYDEEAAYVDELGLALPA
ncbi:MAG: hypothetical protein QOG82_1801 [Actinomycetota bacterium]|jgi:hypothetical protein|nr:hypothetical protein [Actinomycetota bacterium]